MLKDFCIALANIVLLAMILVMAFFGGVMMDADVVYSEELQILNPTTSGGTCSPGGCSIVRK